MSTGKDRPRLMILAILLSLCCYAVYHFHLVLHQETIFSHFFYLPVVLASLWWGRKGVGVAVFLALLMLLTALFTGMSLTAHLIRAAVLLLVAVVVAFLSERSAREQRERKAAEDDLAASKAYTESIIQNFLDTLIVVDAEAKIQTINPATCHLLGYTEEELVGQPVGIIFAEEEEEEEVRQLFQFFREPEKTKTFGPQDSIRNRQLTYKSKDGQLIPMLFNASVLTDERGKVTGVVAGAKDITELKLAEAEIRKEKNFSENIINTVPDAMLVLDKELRIKSANRSFYRLFQTKPKEVIGSKISDILGDEDGKLSGELTKLFGTEDVLENLELPYQSEKLGERIFNITARGIIVAEEEEEEEELLVLEDITEQKKAEKIKDSIYRISEAAHSAQNLEELFRSIHNIIGELMPAKNFYIALYDDDKEILSFPYFVDEYDETPAPKRLGKGLTEYVLRTGEPLLASPEVFEKLEKKGEVESIGTPSIDWLGVPLKTENKTFGVLVVQSYTEGVRFGEKDKEILKFVSDQTAMAIKRKHAEEQVKTSLREKEVLLQEVHHRVKNNMQIISSLLNLQASQMKDKDFIKMVKDSQSRIRSMALVHEKLYRSQDLSRINFSDYTQSLVVHLFQFNQVNSNLIQLKMNLDDVFLEIQTAIPCGLILNELITNSLKHAFPEGSGGEILVELHSLGEHTFQMIVKDNGVGIPEDLNIRETTTLGLQIVTMLVNQIEGSMEVQRDGGTTVKIVFKELRYRSRL